MSKQTKTSSDSAPASSPSKFPKWAIGLGLAAFFLILMGLYFVNPISDGKTIFQSDIIQNRAMAKETMDFRASQHTEPLWNGRLFGGMPAFQIAMIFPNNLFATVDKVVTLGMPSPYRQIWMLFLGFFVLLLVLRVNPYLSFIGALAYAFSSYFFIILQVGHNTKAMAAALIPPIVAGTIWVYRGRYFSGGALVLLALILQIGANHIQVTYYMGIVLIGVAVAALIEAIQRKAENNFFDNITMPRFATGSVILLLMAALAPVPNLSRLWTTYEYTNETMRGKGELTTDGTKKDGLGIEYALRWSYGIMESFNMMIPNMYGGGTGGSESMTPETYKLIKANMGKAKADEMIKNVPTYWGDQPSTAGPTYIGAAIVFLFIFSLVLGFSNIKNWQYGKVFTASMIGVSLLAMMLAWGRNFMPLTQLFFDYFPLYNKFRAVAMILMIVQFVMPMMGLLALNEVLKRKDAKAEILKALKVSGGIALGICVFIFLVGKTSWAFVATGDSKLGEELAKTLMEDRQSMFTFDIFRTMFWILATAGLIWAWLEDKVKETVLILGMGAIVLLDLWTVNKRYLNDSDFIKKSQYQAQLSNTSKADEMILQDKSDYRVLNLAQDPFNDAMTSYHHRSVGGYHPAKLRRYQDMIEANISPEIQILGGILNKGVNDSTIRYAFSQTPVLNMMNTKYLIVQEDNQPLKNPNALGNAWFVSEIKQVNNADEELAGIKNFNPKKTAIVSKDFAAQIAGASFADSAASIKELSYTPNEMKYESNASKEGVAVFSEIYYAKGWEAYIDDKKVDIFRANWVLRGLKVPAGKHNITFKFVPEAYIKGESYALIGSIVALLLIIGMVVADVMMNKKKSAESVIS